MSALLLLVLCSGCALHPIEKEIRKQNLYPYPQFVDKSKLGDVVMITEGDMVPVVGKDHECSLFSTDGKKEILTAEVFNNVFKAKLWAPSGLVDRVFSNLSDVEAGISAENIVKVKFVNPTLAEHDYLTIQDRLEGLSQECKQRLASLDNIHVIFREMYTDGIEYTANTTIKSLLGASTSQEFPDEDEILGADGSAIYFYRGNMIEGLKPFRVAYQVLEVKGIFQNEIKIRRIQPEEFTQYGVSAVGTVPL